MALDLHARRQAGLDVVQRAVEAVGQFKGVGAGLFLDAENHRRLAVVRADAALGCGTDADFGDMADQHRLTVAQGNHRLGNIVEHVDAALALDQVFLRRFDIEAGRGILVRVAQRLADFIQRQAIGGQAFGLDGDLELLGIAADGQDFGHAGHGQNAPLQDLLGGILQFHARMLLGMERDKQNLAHDRGGRGHRRGGIVGRQGGAGQLQPFGHHLAGQIEVGAPLELDGDDGQADLGGGTHPPHPRRPVQRRFDGKGDQALDIGRRHAVRLGDNGDRRCRQVRKNIDRRPSRLPAAPDQQEYAGHDDEEFVA